MSKERKQTVLGLSVFLAVSVCLCASRAAEETPWQVRTASLRYKVDLVKKPTVASAGTIVMIPDGGVLPGPNPVSTVLGAAGNEIPSYCLYYTRKYGLAVLFQPPATAKSVYVYLKGDMEMNVYTPDSGMTPSMLLYVRKGQSSLGAAKQIKPGKTQDSVEFIRHHPIKNDPMQISCEITRRGMHGEGSSYSASMTGYLMTTDPGRTWISAFSIYGDKTEPTQAGMEVYIDNTRIKADTKLSDKSCGAGQWMELNKGLHKINIYHATDPVRDLFGALLTTWRTPDTTTEELGGMRGSDLPYPNTPMWEARRMRESEIVRSGKGIVSSIEERNGAPLACFEVRPLAIFWLSDEAAPLLAYEFRAVTAGNPEGAGYIWEPARDTKIEGKEKISWLFPGYKESSMTLTVTAGSRKSTATLPFFGYEPTLRTDLNDPSARETFRDACLTMLQAYPPNEDPTESWSPAMWELFLATLELGSSRPLLAQIFSHNWDSMRKRLDSMDRWRLEDAFHEWYSFRDPEECLLWLEKTEKNERHTERRKELRLMRSEVYIYFLKDFDAARKLAVGASAGAGDVSALAKVRLGDIEFLRGDINEATRLYGGVQSKSETDNYLGTDADGLQWSAPPQWKTDTGSSRRKTPSPGTKDRVNNWKKGAVLDTSASETVKTLLKQGYYEEARNVLLRWETLFPLSKLSSDFIIHQADLYMKLGNYGKARTLLEAYCEHVETSSYIAPAVDMLLECMEKTNATDADLETFAGKMKKRLEFHPVAEKMDALLNKLKRKR